jgi:hypothetical protein
MGISDHLLGFANWKRRWGIAFACIDSMSPLSPSAPETNLSIYSFAPLWYFRELYIQYYYKDRPSPTVRTGHPSIVLQVLYARVNEPDIYSYTVRGTSTPQPTTHDLFSSSRSRAINFSSRNGLSPRL